MSIIIFFTMAFFIFTAGLIAIGLSIYNWYVQSRASKELNSQTRL